MIASPVNTRQQSSSLVHNGRRFSSLRSAATRLHTMTGLAELSHDPLVSMSEERGIGVLVTMVLRLPSTCEAPLPLPLALPLEMTAGVSDAL